MYDSIIQRYENIDSSKIIKQQQTIISSEQSPLRKQSLSNNEQQQALHHLNFNQEQYDDQKQQHNRSIRFWKCLQYFECCQNKKWFKMNSITNIFNQQNENQQTVHIENDSVNQNITTISTLQQQQQEEEEEMNQNNNNYYYWKQEQQYSWIYVLISGQALAFGLACGSAAQAALVSQCHVSAPAFSIGLVYLCLTILILPLLYYETHSTSGSIRQQRQQHHHPLPSDELETDIPTSSTSFAVPVVITDSEQHDESNVVVDTHEVTNETEPELDSERNNNTKYTFLFGHINLVAPAYVYLLLSILDFYANYLTVLAFRYTTLTSVTLLDATAIPTSMILSKLLLKRHYTIFHLIGVSLCIVGVFINVQHDYEDDIDTTTTHSSNITTNSTNESIVYPYKFKGDMYAFIGGALFGCVNVFGEIAVRNYGGPNEYIGMIGFFGTFVCIVHGLLIDHTIFTGFHYIQDDTTNYSNNDTNSTSNTTSTGETMRNNIDTCTPVIQYMYLSLFVTAATAVYIGGSRFLQYAEAAFLNLSFLTADFWSVIFSIFTLQIIPKPLFFVALVLTVAGVIVYETVPTTSIIVSSSDDKRQHQQHQQPEWTSMSQNDEDNDESCVGEGGAINSDIDYNQVVVVTEQQQ